jgi:hypothetical protein
MMIVTNGSIIDQFHIHHGSKYTVLDLLRFVLLSLQPFRRIDRTVFRLGPPSWSACNPADSFWSELISVQCKLTDEKTRESFLLDRVSPHATVVVVVVVVLQFASDQALAVASTPARRSCRARKVQRHATIPGPIWETFWPSTTAEADLTRCTTMVEECRRV